MGKPHWFKFKTLKNWIYIWKAPRISGLYRQWKAVDLHKNCQLENHIFEKIENCCLQNIRKESLKFFFQILSHKFALGRLTCYVYDIYAVSSMHPERHFSLHNFQRWLKMVW